MNIYWSSRGINPLLLEPPTNVLQELKKSNFLHGEETSGYYRCPGYTEFFKNMYVIKSTIDFELEHIVDDDGSRVVINKDQNFFDENIFVEKYSKEQQMIHINSFLYLFSEKDVDVSVMPAFFHESDLYKEHYIVSGKFNISKWFRPLYPNIILKSNKLKIKRGDALFYLKFHTDESINFKHFKLNETILGFSVDCLNLKHNVSNMGFKRLYNLFMRKNYNKKIMKEIKKNLTGDFE